jgi:hypothetical protein
MESNPYLLQTMVRVSHNSFLVTFFDKLAPNLPSLCLYRYGPNEKVNYYHLDGTEVTVDTANLYREAMNHVFNEVD